MILKMNRFFALPLFSFAISIIPVIGLYKLCDDSVELVTNARPDVLYLFQFPRTSIIPSISPLSLKVEIWMHWHKIPFHRLSNRFLLGSHWEGTAPFAYLDGKYVGGSDRIIERAAKHFGKRRLAEGPEGEREVRRMIDEELFGMLIYDRSERMEWMLRDEGIREQLIPMLVEDGIWLEVPPMKEEEGVEGWKIRMDEQIWERYFDARRRGEPARRKAFMQRHLIRKKTKEEEEEDEKEEGRRKAEEEKRRREEGEGEVGGGIEKGMEEEEEEEKEEMVERNMTEEVEEEKEEKKEEEEKVEEMKKEEEGEEEAKKKREEEEEAEHRWTHFSDWLDTKVVEPTLARELLERVGGSPNLENPTNLQAKLRRFLKRNKLNGANARKHFSEFTVQEIRDELSIRLDKLRKMLRENDGKGLFGKEAYTPADASLFAMLLQFYGTPLNYAPIKELLFGGDLEDLFHKFMQNVAKSLGMNGERDNSHRWRRIRHWPWLLNFDTELIFKFDIRKPKYDSTTVPYKFDAAGVEFDSPEVRVFSYIRGKVSYHAEHAAKHGVPTEILAATNVFVEMANSEGVKHHRYWMVLGMFHAMAAFLCNNNNKALQQQQKQSKRLIGRAMDRWRGGNDCASRHLAKARKLFGEAAGGARRKEEVGADIERAKALVYGSIGAWNDAKVAQNVKAAVAEARGRVKAGGEAAEKAEGTTEFANEF